MGLIITSILTFASTNIDDIFVLILFYGNKNFKERDIVLGQVLGIGALIALSLLASLVGLIISTAYIGLLGLFPVYLGISSLWEKYNRRQGDDEPAPGPASINKQSKWLTVAGVTFANGGDNIAIYTPFFATRAWTEKLSMILMFFVLTMVWCFLAKYLTKHPLVAKAVDKYGHLITPVVLIFIGVYILYESGTLALLR